MSVSAIHQQKQCLQQQNAPVDQVFRVMHLPSDVTWELTDVELFLSFGWLWSNTQLGPNIQHLVECVRFGSLPFLQTLHSMCSTPGGDGYESRFSIGKRVALRGWKAIRQLPISSDEHPYIPAQKEVVMATLQHIFLSFSFFSLLHIVFAPHSHSSH